VHGWLIFYKSCEADCTQKISLLQILLVGIRRAFFTMKAMH
jgi:hypothetical protein